LAIAAGTACVLSIMAAYEYGKGHSWPRYGSQFILFVAFLVADFPIAVSYLMCARRVIEEQSRAVGYMLFLIVTAMIVDITAAVLVRNHYSCFGYSHCITANYRYMDTSAKYSWVQLSRIYKQRVAGR
jgi:hypothetical protein